MIHVVLIALGIVLLETVPGITQDVTWTTANLGYLFVSYQFTLPSLLYCPRSVIEIPRHMFYNR